MSETRTVRLSEAINIALEHHRAGRVAEAESIYRQVLATAPDNFDALYLLGVIEHQREHHDAAVALIRRALSLNPAVAAAQNSLGDAYLALHDIEEARRAYRAAIEADPGHAEAHNGLGVTYWKERSTDEAATCFRRALAIAPDMAQAHFNLGLCLKAQSNPSDAAREFRSGWVSDPTMLSAARECVDTVADLARSVPDYQGTYPLHASGSLPMTSIVFCSIDERKAARTREMYGRLFAGAAHELIVIRDARSLAEAYNRGIASSRGEVIVLSHDDVDILAPDFAARLHGHMLRFDAVGVMGATELSGPGWNWSRHPYLRGWITHRAPEDREWSAAIVDPRPVAEEIVTLDGVLMAARRAVFNEVQFDDEVFDGFHLYDIDWSYRVAAAGFRIGVVGDLRLVHESRGRFDGEWAQHAERFCAKHCLELGDLPPPPPSQLFEARFGTVGEVHAFFDRLTNMCN